MVKVKKEVPENETVSADEAVSESKAKKSAVKFYWVKLRAYVDEAGTKRIDKGLYETSESFPRLERANKSVCEIFEGEIPDRKLVEIAKALGVSTDTKDLLNVLVNKNVILF